MNDILNKLMTAMGFIGGTLGVITFFSNRKEKKLGRDRLIFTERIKHTYLDLFEDDKYYETGNINTLLVYRIVPKIIALNESGNKFESCEVQFLFIKVYAWAKKSATKSRNGTGY